MGGERDRQKVRLQMRKDSNKNKEVALLKELWKQGKVTGEMMIDCVVKNQHLKERWRGGAGLLSCTKGTAKPFRGHGGHGARRQGKKGDDC